MAAIPINFAQVFNFDEVFEDDSIRFENKGGGQTKIHQLSSQGLRKNSTRWAPVTSFKLGYFPYKWSYRVSRWWL